MSGQSVFYGSGMTGENPVQPSDHRGFHFAGLPCLSSAKGDRTQAVFTYKVNNVDVKDPKSWLYQGLTTGGTFGPSGDAAVVFNNELVGAQSLGISGKLKYVNTSKYSIFPGEELVAIILETWTQVTDHMHPVWCDYQGKVAPALIAPMGSLAKTSFFNDLFAVGVNPNDKIESLRNHYQGKYLKRIGTALTLSRPGDVTILAA